MLCFCCKALAFLLYLHYLHYLANPIAHPKNSSNDFGMMIEDLQVNDFYFAYRKSWMPMTGTFSLTQTARTVIVDPLKFDNHKCVNCGNAFHV